MECLSMGMSDDLPTPSPKAPTMVRIGTAIFGKRNYNIRPTRRHGTIT